MQLISFRTFQVHPYMEGIFVTNLANILLGFRGLQTYQMKFRLHVCKQTVTTVLPKKSHPSSSVQSVLDTHYSLCFASCIFWHTSASTTPSSWPYRVCMICLHCPDRIQVAIQCSFQVILGLIVILGLMCVTILYDGVSLLLLVSDRQVMHYSCIDDLQLWIHN